MTVKTSGFLGPKVIEISAWGTFQLTILLNKIKITSGWQPMLAFSIAATKLPSYITPGYPHRIFDPRPSQPKIPGVKAWLYINTELIETSEQSCTLVDIRVKS